MADSNAARVKRVRMAPTLSGRERLKVLLAAQGYTVAGYARARGFHDSQVWMCISGTRPYPEIRDDLAEVLGKARSTIDALIGGEDTGEDTGEDEGSAREVSHADTMNLSLADSLPDPDTESGQGA